MRPGTDEVEPREVQSDSEVADSGFEIRGVASHVDRVVLKIEEVSVG